MTDKSLCCTCLSYKTDDFDLFLYGSVSRIPRSVLYPRQKMIQNTRQLPIDRRKKIDKEKKDETNHKTNTNRQRYQRPTTRPRLRPSSSPLQHKEKGRTLFATRLAYHRKHTRVNNKKRVQATTLLGTNGTLPFWNTISIYDMTLQSSILVIFSNH
jgi:hypothetical protein